MTALLLPGGATSAAARGGAVPDGGGRHLERPQRKARGCRPAAAMRSAPRLLLLALLVFPAALLLRGSGAGEGNEGKGCCWGGGGGNWRRLLTARRPSRRGVLQSADRRSRSPCDGCSRAAGWADGGRPPWSFPRGGALLSFLSLSFPAPATSSALLASDGNAASWGSGGGLRAKGAWSSLLSCSAVGVWLIRYLRASSPRKLQWMKSLRLNVACDRAKSLSGSLRNPREGLLLAFSNRHWES